VQARAGSLICGVFNALVPPCLTASVSCGIRRMTRSERITEYTIRAVAAPVAGLFGAVVAVLPAFLLLDLMEGAPAFVFVLVQLAASVVKGFAFVFVGSLVATIAWRVRAACILLGLGILFYSCFQYYPFPNSHYERGSGISVWVVLHLAVTIAGGFLAVAILHRRRYEKTS
jgi:hypothetical protein